MEQNIRLTGTLAIVVGVLVVLVVIIRLVTFSDSQDASLEKAVRAELWSTYSGILGVEISEIRSSGDYSDVDSLLGRASSDAIIIEQISRSEPILAWSSNQKVIVRVHYQFPDDSSTRKQYMKFNHGTVSGWQYRYDTSAISYYLNFF